MHNGYHRIAGAFLAALALMTVGAFVGCSTSSSSRPFKVSTNRDKNGVIQSVSVHYDAPNGVTYNSLQEVQDAVWDAEDLIAQLKRARDEMMDEQEHRSARRSRAESP